MKENANPIVYNVLADTSLTASSKMQQVATGYLDPFLSPQEYNNNNTRCTSTSTGTSTSNNSSSNTSNTFESIPYYSSPLISSYHTAMGDIMNLDRRDTSATRDACCLLKTFRNVSTNHPTEESSRSNDHSSPWQPKLVFGTSNRKAAQSTSVMTTNQNIISERDSITHLEIFNIIRNIQDPEHPLTLEQLNVVNMDSVSFTCSHMDAVVDNNDNNDDDNDDDNNDNNDNNNDDDKDENEDNSVPTVYIKFTPTIPHCSMATLIGLCIKVKLMRSLNHWNIDVRIKKGTHVSETAINRQLNDKERVKASLENEHLLNVVNKCVRGVVAVK